MIIPTQIKAATIVATIFIIVWKYQTYKSSFEQTTDFITNYHENVMAKFELQKDVIIGGTTYDNMLSEVTEDLLIFEDMVSTVPTLINTVTDTLLTNLQSRFDSRVLPTIQSFKDEKEVALTQRIPVILDEILGNVDIEFYELSDSLVSSEDTITMIGYYQQMSSEMKERFISEITLTFETDTNSRIERIEEFYAANLAGSLLMYKEFIEGAKKMATSFAGENQAENYIKAIAQSRISEAVANNLKYSMITDYASGVMTDDDMASFLDEFFGSALVIRQFMDDEITFRSENNHVSSILENRASQLYLNAFDVTTNNNIISDDQRRSLNTYAKAQYDSLLVYFSTNSSVQTYTFEALKGFSDYYLNSMLPKVYTYVYAMFVELKNVLQRSLLEGSQTCILQFFEMRRVLDFEFFFAIAQEQDFDLDLTESVYRELYDEQLATARTRMIGYARLPYIMYLYDDSLDFLNVSAELLFFSDSDLRPVMDEITETFHDQISISVTDFLDLGIESVYEEESSSSKAIVDGTFVLFKKNMEFMKASHLVSEISSIVSLEISQKIEYVTGMMPDLINEFKGEVTEPFTNEWMQTTQQSFLTDDDIDFDGMKRFVVEEMNVVAQTVTESYITIVTEYVDAQIGGISETLSDVSVLISSAVQASPVSDEDKITIGNSLVSTVENLEGTISSVKTALLVNLNSVIQAAIVSLDQVMDINTQNFFNTSIREVVEVFQATAGQEFTELYYTHIDLMSSAYKTLANQAKGIFESRTRRIVAAEVGHRALIGNTIGQILGAIGADIVSDYDIVSYNSRRSIILNKMRGEVIQGVLGLRIKRNSDISEEERDYSIEVAQFRNTYQQTAAQLVADFTSAYSDMVTETYERAADVLHMVQPVLVVIEGDLKKSLTDSYATLVGQVVFVKTNDLPAIDMLSISYAHGIIATSDSFDGDLQSIMRESLIIPEIVTTGGAEYLDESQITSEVENSLDTLGASDSSITHIDISLAMSEYEAWEEMIVDTQIEVLETTMGQTLKENTCPIKPTCKDGGACSRELENLQCREGYVLGVNSHGIPCCLFDPVSAGFPVAAIAGLLLEEMALMFFTDPGALGNVAKMTRYMAKGLSKVASKSASKFLVVSAKFSGKASGAFAKVGVKMGRKMAIKTGRKAGMKLAKKVITKTLGKIALKVGAKAGAKVAGKVVVKALASGALKSLMKVAASGPIGVALLVFDLLSLALDLWDPAGYNDAQMAGQIQGTRDSIETYYKEALASDGVTSPLLPDTMYNVDPSTKGLITEELMMQWFSDQMLAFTSSNEERWQYMSVSQASEEQNAEVERLTDVIFTEPNFMEELTCRNTENTFMVRASKINGTSPLVVGTSLDKDYDEFSDTHLSICCLNQTGINLHNSFNKQKTEFINDMVKNPLYRWTKIADEGGYTIYSEMTESELLKVDVEIARRKQVVNSGKTLSDAELSAPIISKFGWSLILVDPESEFWKQYVYSQEEGTEIPTRGDFGNAWDSDEVDNKEYYVKLINASMEEILAEMVPCDEDTGTCEGLASIKMIQDQTDEAPEWYPTYDELYILGKGRVDENVLANLEESLEIARQNEAITAILNLAMDEQYAEDLDVSVATATKERIKSSFDVDSQLQEPDFAVYKKGFGRMSPLLSIKQTCDDMGYGVTFNQGKGLCNFTQEYCDRFGLTYFFNEDVGVYDCKLATSQKVFESIFGTTVTRSVKRLAKHAVSGESKEEIFGEALGSAGEMIDLEFEKNMPALGIMNGLDELGLGSKYSIW